MPSGGGSSPSACTGGLTPRGRIWRLSAEQYLNTVRATFGYGTVTPTEAGDDPHVTTGFTADATNSVDLYHTSFYSDTAAEAARRAVANLKTAQPCMTAASVTDACLADFINGNGERAFRRPIAVDELGRYTKFFRDSATPYGIATASQMVLEAMMQAPSFLYRTEIGSGSKGEVELTPYEVASALSYTLTDAPPAADLMAAAKDGSLRTPAVREMFARRLVKKAEAKDAFGRFLQEQLRLDQLDQNASLAAALRGDMRQEVLKFGGAVLGDPVDGTLKTLLSASFTYANDRLAPTYGVKTASPTDLARVELNPNERSGLVTMAGFLAGEPGPVQRAITTKKAFLCEELPRPPDNAVAMANMQLNPAPGSTAREFWTLFAQKLPGCMEGCHAAFVPLAIAFDAYSSVGKYRTANTANHPIVTAGTVQGADGWSGVFRDIPDVARQVAGTPKGAQCFVQRYATYAWGRPTSAGDSCALDRLNNAFAQKKLSLEELLVATTQDPSFYKRVNEE
jgi:hypothetical protein